MALELQLTNDATCCKGAGFVKYYFSLKMNAAPCPWLITN